MIPVLMQKQHKEMGFFRLIFIKNGNKKLHNHYIMQFFYKEN